MNLRLLACALLGHRPAGRDPGRLGFQPNALLFLGASESSASVVVERCGRCQHILRIQTQQADAGNAVQFGIG